MEASGRGDCYHRLLEARDVAESPHYIFEMPRSSWQATRKDGRKIGCHQFPDELVGQYPNITQHHTSAMSAPLGFPRSMGLATSAEPTHCRPHTLKRWFGRAYGPRIRAGEKGVVRESICANCLISLLFLRVGSEESEDDAKEPIASTAGNLPEYHRGSVTSPTAVREAIYGSKQARLSY